MRIPFQTHIVYKLEKLFLYERCFYMYDCMYCFGIEKSWAYAGFDKRGPNYFLIAVATENIHV